MRKTLGIVAVLLLSAIASGGSTPAGPGGGGTGVTAGGGGGTTGAAGGPDCWIKFAAGSPKPTQKNNKLRADGTYFTSNDWTPVKITLVGDPTGLYPTQQKSITPGDSNPNGSGTWDIAMINVPAGGYKLQAVMDVTKPGVAPQQYTTGYSPLVDVEGNKD